MGKQLKKCSKCKVEKPFVDFPKCAAQKSGYYPSCKACKKQYHIANAPITRAIARRWYGKNRKRVVEKNKAYKDSHKQQYRNQYLVRTYGITLEQYNQMYDNQGGGCKICGKKCRLVVDHCHTTGKVRGLLCSQHNTGLGLFQDNPEFLIAGAMYVRG